MTRHELKEQLQHDQFTDIVSEVVQYASSHRQRLIQYAIAGAVAVLVTLGAIWYMSYRRSAREQDLQAAFAVLDAQVGPANPDSPVKTFPTQDAKNRAAIKALSDVVAKNSGSKEGLIAQYYLGTLKAQTGNTSGAESDLRSVADTGNPTAPLAKIALAQLYAGENRTSEAQKLLSELINKPTGLVSKGQAQIMLARLDQSVNPKEAKKILQGLSTPKEDPVVRRAADQLASELK